jgi:hypothetical protein
VAAPDKKKNKGRKIRTSSQVPIHFQEVEGENAINGIGAGLFKIFGRSSRLFSLLPVGVVNLKKNYRMKKKNE